MWPLAIICVLVFFVKFVDPEEGCVFSVVEKWSPLLVDPYNTTLLRPKNGKILLGYGDLFTIFCPAYPHIKDININNHYSRTKKTTPSHLQAVLVQCMGGKKIKIIFLGIIEDLDDCSRIIEGSIKETNKTCGLKNQGTFFNIGYRFESECFMPMIKVCYILNNYTTLYTLHMIHGQEIRNAPIVPHFFGYGDSFAEGVEQSYNIPAQKKMWQKLFGEEIFPDDNYLMDGHLTPYLDFVTTAAQYTSKHSITVVPIWRSIYKGNWRKIEGMIRTLADTLRDVLFIYSGTHEIFIQQQGQKSIGLFLMDNNRVPVPKFVYKLVYYKQERKAIVIIVLNNPFNDTKLPGDSKKCSGVCENLGWASNTFTDQKLGRAYCCPYEYLVANFPNSPSILVTGLLEGPQNAKSFDFFQDFDKDSGNIGTSTVKSLTKSSTEAGKPTSLTKSSTEAGKPTSLTKTSTEAGKPTSLTKSSTEAGKPTSLTKSSTEAGKPTGES